MVPIGQVLKLKPGCYDEYKRRHDDLWPELSEAMAANGLSMIVYRFDDYLFVHGTAPSNEAWDEMAAHPVTPRWNQFMTDVLETDDRGNLIRQVLPPAFAFGALAHEA